MPPSLLTVLTFVLQASLVAGIFFVLFRNLRRSRDRFRTVARLRSDQLQKRDAELAESEALYRDLFENSHDLIQVTDGSGRFQLVNKAWCRALGYSRTQALELTMEDVVSTASFQSWEQLISDLSAERPTGLVELELSARDGTSVAAEGNVSGVFAGGRLVATRSIFRDVSERREVEKLKDSFIATISHELRTPLTSIHGALDLIDRGKAGDVSEKSRKYVSIALRNSRRLMALVSEIVDLERVKSGAWPLVPETLEIEPALVQLLEEQEGFAQSMAARLELEIDESAVTSTVVDPGAFRIIVTNFISNALKHSPKGGRVTVAVQSSDGWLEISVRDQGPGVSQEQLRHLFQPFSRPANAKQAVKISSSGLGLSIAKTLSDRMGSRIGLNEAYSGGAEFFVAFPPEPAAAPPGREQLQGGREWHES